jgi:hypothetical protein
MDDLEEKINRVLSDPEEMAKIAAMAKSMGFSPPEGAGPVPPGPEADAPPPGPQSSGLPPGVAELLGEAGKTDSRQAALFSALRPFLKPEHRDRLDRAVRAAQLSHMASFALKNMERGDHKPEGG